MCAEHQVFSEWCHLASALAAYEAGAVEQQRYLSCVTASVSTL